MTTFYNFKSFQIILTYRSNPQKGSTGGESFVDVLWICCEFLGAYPSVGVISIKLQSGFVEIALLHCCYAVCLLHVFRVSFLENTSGGLLLKKDCFIYNF